GPDEYRSFAEGDYGLMKVAEIYAEYQKSLKSNGMMDFDDLIMNTVILFREFPEVLEFYRERFKYIMVDEYQDTNSSQFELVRLLSGKYKNLCVVGDDDQSIYRFRGANIYNILNFEKHFPDTYVVRLEENYRSTETILEAANAVIKNNTERKSKALWTRGGKGEKIRFRQLDDPAGEASFIADDIRKKVSEGRNEYGDFAILTRTNIQSKELEDALRIRHIEYEVVKGLRFWDTAVIKDMTSYLMTVDNGENEMRIRRIINVPKRGIGNASIDKISLFARANGMSFYEALSHIDNIPSVPAKAKNAVKEFYGMSERIRSERRSMSFSEMLDSIIDETGYLEYLMSEAESSEKFREQREYIEKLKETLKAYEDETEEPDLTDFLRINGLEGNNLDKEGGDEEGSRVLIMTMHNAKGLEFPEVYMAGMEEGLFPGYASINSDDPLAIEEERRLCYVGITRARERLTLTAARKRMVNGETRYAAASRFLKEIPRDLTDMNVTPEKTERHERIFPSDRESARRIFEERPPAFSPGFRKSSPVSLKKGSDIGKTKPSYSEGDRVLHFKFGEGTVLSIKDGGRDYEVTVDFDNTGVRKMFAGFAKLKPL
ncbi:MAG: UvrD-helicase domain-containing protein, partial [Lachnospiraceae bacterium]|nr:UvrD-helicase domain-containing protein [Lachnospiraceae bacterium]